MSTVLDVPRVDAMPRVAEDAHVSLRLWLQLLACSALIERHVRERLRDRFDITLPRFDMMAQLDREPKGLKMSELSRRLMVTGGNVTGLTDQLVAEGLVMRRGIPGDRRAYNIRLTPKGKRQFDAMAIEHEAWIVELLAEVPAATREALHESLAQLKIALATRLASRSEPHAAE
jgi:DNA-binding MarR family transcriptional regulator